MLGHCAMSGRRCPMPVIIFFVKNRLTNQMFGHWTMSSGPITLAEYVIFNDLKNILIMLMHNSFSAKSSTKSRNITSYNIDLQVSSLNKPHNPHERFFIPNVNMDITDFEYSPPTNSKDQIATKDSLISLLKKKLKQYR
ncbi:3733_t:CDS:2, partial [Gigaspora rosea]